MSMEKNPGNSGNSQLGFWMAVGSAILFAVSPSLSKIGYEAGAGPITSAAMRGVFLLGLFLWPILKLLHEMCARKTSAGTYRSHLLPLIGYGLAYACFSYFYQTAIAEIGIALPLVAVSASALVIVAIDILTGSRSAGVIEFLTACLTIAGVALLMDDITTTPLGLFHTILSLVTVTITILLAGLTVRRGADGSQRSAVLGIVLTLTLLPPAILFENLALPSGALGWLGFLGGAITVALAMSLLTSAITHISLLRAVLISNAEPALGVVLAWVIVGEEIGPIGWIGILLALSGIVDWRPLAEAASRKRSARVSSQTIT